MTGGRVQPGKAQCRSRRMRASQSAVVTRRRVRPTSRTSLRVPRTAGTRSASHARRRTTPAGGSRPSAGVPPPGPGGPLRGGGGGGGGVGVGGGAGGGGGGGGAHAGGAG